MTRSLAVLAAAAAIAGAVAGIGRRAPRPALSPPLLVAAVGAPCPARRPRPRREPRGASAASGGSSRSRPRWRSALVLACVLAGAVLMFVSHHDALLVSAIVRRRRARRRAHRDAARRRRGRATSSRCATRSARSAPGAASVDAAVGAHDEVGELARAADAMARRLGHEEARREAADAARRSLVAAVSHDLRTPVTALRLLVESVEDDIVDAPTRRRYLATMQSHIRALSAMIDDLFELSRIEAGDIEWSIRRVELAARRRRDGRRDGRRGARQGRERSAASCPRARSPPAPTRRRSSACSST